MLGFPEPEVLAAAKAAWHEDRKPANILLILDTSGSMQDEHRLARAKEGLEVFFREVAPQDRVGLLAFNQELGVTLPLREFREGGNQLKRTINNLIADGEDTDSSRSYDQALEALGSQGDSENRVRLFTIAYSAGATGAQEQLAALAAATGGKAYEGSTEDIESVCRSISSFF